jgi:hypothetical protein
MQVNKEEMKENSDKDAKLTQKEIKDKKVENVKRLLEDKRKQIKAEFTCELTRKKDSTVTRTKCNILKMKGQKGKKNTMTERL